MIELIILIIKAIANAGNSSANRQSNPIDAARLAEWERAQREWQALQLRALTGKPPARVTPPPVPARARPALVALQTPPPVPVTASVPDMLASAPIVSRSDGGARPTPIIRQNGVNHRVQARARFILSEVLQPPLSLRREKAGAW